MPAYTVALNSKRGHIIECCLAIFCGAHALVRAALAAALMFPYNPSSPPFQAPLQAIPPAHPPNCMAHPQHPPTHPAWFDPQNPATYLRPAVSLLQVWMRRQGLSGQSDGFSGFLMTMLTAHLVQQGRLVRKVRPVHAALCVCVAVWALSTAPSCETLDLDNAAA